MASPTNDAYDKVHGERGEDYGHPLDDFSTTADLLNALGFCRIDKHGSLRNLKAEDISVQQRMVKESRRYTSPDHYDSLVDIPGYAETEQMVIEERAKREGPEDMSAYLERTNYMSHRDPTMVPPDEVTHSRELHEAFLERMNEAPVPDPEKYDEREVE